MHKPMSSARRICYTAGYDGDQRESIKSPSLRESSELGDYARVAGNADTTPSHLSQTDDPPRIPRRPSASRLTGGAPLKGRAQAERRICQTPGLRLSNRRRWGGGMLRWRLGALDDEPQHEGHLPEGGGLRVGKHPVIILRGQYARKAQDHPGESAQGEPDAQKPRQESRPVHQQGERNEPKTPKYFVNNKSVKMQTEEQHRQSLPLGLFEYGEEIGPAHEDEGSDGVQLIQKRYRDLDHNQCHHKRGVPPVDPLEQVVQSQGHEDKTSLADELASHAEAKERLGGRDVVGGRRSVSLDDDLAGNIHHGEETRN